MNEEQQTNNGVPAETQRSGLGGEKRSSGADECSTSHRVSRETGSPGGADGPNSGPADVSRETKTPNRKSSVYLYLLVLFSAAFLMLLLAYFIQQRNNQATIDGLQDSWNLSRGELVEENRKLTEKNEELEVRLAVMEDQRNNANRQIDALDAQLYAAQTSYESLRGGYDKYVGYTSILETLYSGEVKLADGDYTGAAAELTDIDFDYLISTIDEYDAEIEHYNPEGMFLRPRFDALVSALVKRGALDESWPS